MAPMVSQSDVRANLSTNYQTKKINDMNKVNGFDYSTLTAKVEERPKCSIHSTASAGLPVRRFLGEFTPTYFQTSSLPIRNKRAGNIYYTDHQDAD